VEVRLTTDYIPISVTNNTVYNTVQALIFSGFGNAGDLKNAFDEVRFVSGKIYYMPRYVFGGNSSSAAIMEFGGAAIDFANATAFGSTVSLMDHDNHVMFTLLALTTHPTEKERFSAANAIWDVIPDFVPSGVWEDANASTNIAWWKPYFLAADITQTVTVGYLIMDAVWQFRGMR
jgi:hypothetical protein